MWISLANGFIFSKWVTISTRALDAASCLARRAMRCMKGRERSVFFRRTAGILCLMISPFVALSQAVVARAAGLFLRLTLSSPLPRILMYANCTLRCGPKAISRYPSKIPPARKTTLLSSPTLREATGRQSIENYHLKQEKLPQGVILLFVTLALLGGCLVMANCYSPLFHLS